MSIATEIQRIQNNKAAIKTALENKGLTLTDDMSTWASAVDDISTGGDDSALIGLLDGTATSVTIPDGTTKLRDYCFYKNTGLTSIDIPDTVTSLGSACFGYCSSLINITLPNLITILNYSIFEGCSKLSSITIPDSVTSLGIACFQNCSKLSSITIPDSVTSICESAFYNCSKLTSITIPDSVTSIGNNCFYNCSGLTTVKLGNSLTSMNRECFTNCTSLTSVLWNSNLKYIHDATFYNCTKLTTLDLSAATDIIRFYSSTSTTVGNNNYINIHTGLQIIVPKDLYNDWKASTYWVNFVDYLYWRDDDGNLQNTDPTASDFDMSNYTELEGDGGIQIEESGTYLFVMKYIEDGMDDNTGGVTLTNDESNESIDMIFNWDSIGLSTVTIYLSTTDDEGNETIVYTANSNLEGDEYTGWSYTNEDGEYIENTFENDAVYVNDSPFKLNDTTVGVLVNVTIDEFTSSTINKGRLDNLTIYKQNE